MPQNRAVGAISFFASGSILEEGFWGMKFLFSIKLQVWFIEFEQNIYTWVWKDRGLLHYRRVFECYLPGNEKYITIVTSSPHWWNCWVSFLCKLMSWQLASPASHKNASVLYFVVNAAQENRRWTSTWYMKYEWGELEQCFHSFTGSREDLLVLLLQWPLFGQKDSWKLKTVY